MEKIKKDLQQTHHRYQNTAADLERTVKRLVSALDVVYNRPGIIFWRGIIKGLGQGLGATIGVTIVFIFLSWILRQLGGIPFFSDWLNELSHNLPLGN
jgi:hypothetical protein